MEDEEDSGFGTTMSQTLYRCEECPFTCKLESDMIVHENKHADLKRKEAERAEGGAAARKRKKLFQCQYCPISMKRNCDLLAHEKTHTGEKPFKCSMCEYACRKAFDLKNHEMVHTGEKPYKCELCDYSSRTRSYLKIHQRVHTGFSVKCDFCDFRANTQAHVNTHMKKHMGIVQKCRYCDYTCVLKCKMKLHEKKHFSGMQRGSKELKCQFCNFRCSRLQYLKKHELKHLIDPTNIGIIRYGHVKLNSDDMIPDDDEEDGDDGDKAHDFAAFGASLMRGGTSRAKGAIEGCRNDLRREIIDADVEDGLEDVDDSEPTADDPSLPKSSDLDKSEERPKKVRETVISSISSCNILPNDQSTDDGASNDNPSDGPSSKNDSLVEKPQEKAARKEKKDDDDLAFVGMMRVKEEVEDDDGLYEQIEDETWADLVLKPRRPKPTNPRPEYQIVFPG